MHVLRWSDAFRGPYTSGIHHYITLGTCILSQDLYYKTFLNTKKQRLRFHYSKTLNKAVSELELVFGTDQSMSVDLASLEHKHISACNYTVFF